MLARGCWSDVRLGMKTNIRRLVHNTIEWEEINPVEEYIQKIETEDEFEALTKPSRYYIPAPLTDAELLTLKQTELSEWPKSRVVWALGRIGYVDSLKSNTDEIFKFLLIRSSEIIPSLNSRDIVRITQAVAYGPSISREAVDVVMKLRKQLFVKMEAINEPFLISFIYGHLKLISRVDWEVCDNCKRSNQFLISELIHRKSKIDAKLFLDISAVLISNVWIQRFNADCISSLVQHGVDHCIAHTRSGDTLASFGKSLVGNKCSNGEFFSRINEKIINKFKKKENLKFGFYFLLADLLSLATCNVWLGAVRRDAEGLSSQLPDVVILTESNLVEYHDFLKKIRKHVETIQMLRLVKVLLRYKEYDKLIDPVTMDWLHSKISDESDDSLNSAISGKNSGLTDVVEKVLYGHKNVAGLESPVIGIDSRHLSKVIRRMTESVVEDNFFNTNQIGPFILPVSNIESKICIEWTDQDLLEPPHRRGVARVIQEIRRDELKKQGWRIVLLNRKDFRRNQDETSFDRLNDLFKKSVASQVGKSVVIPWKSPPDEMKNSLSEPKKVKEFALPQITDPSPGRYRRESRAKEYRVQSRLQAIRKNILNSKLARK